MTGMACLFSIILFHKLPRLLDAAALHLLGKEADQLPFIVIRPDLVLLPLPLGLLWAPRLVLSLASPSAHFLFTR